MSAAACVVPEKAADITAAPTIAHRDRDAIAVMRAEHALNTIEILLTYTCSDVAWEIIEPALETLHKVLHMRRREVGLPAKREAA